MSNDRGSVIIYDTSLNVWDDACAEDLWHLTPLFVEVLRELWRRGFECQKHPGHIKHYPSICHWHWVGKRRDLEFCASAFGRHLQVEFFQNVNFENRAGGQYDFNKFSKMPRTMQLECIVVMRTLARFLIERGYAMHRRNRFHRRSDETVPGLLALRDKMRARQSDDPLVEFNERWGDDRFERDETGFPSPKELAHWDNRDMDGIPIHTGETRHLRVRGRIMRGRCYPNMNGMWQFRYGAQTAYEHASRFTYFAHPELEPRRFVSGQVARLEQELRKEVERKCYQRTRSIAAALERSSAA